MAFLDKNGLQTLTNKLVQGDAIKVASHRGHTVANVIDNITRECKNVATPNTMNLENRVSEFKVGQGRDVDVSGDVEEGKVEVELQGKTWQNVVHGKKSVQNNIFTMEDGKYVFNNNTTSSGGIIFSIICKPKTTYTLIINFLECALGDNTIYIDGYPVYLATTSTNLPKTKGTHAISFVTKDDVTDKKMKLAISNSSTSKLVIDENIIVLEGDHTQTPVEELLKYFDGIKSSFEDGVVDVEVQGKNLFDGNYTLEMSDKRLTTSYIKVEPNTAYTCSFNGVIFNRNSLIQYDSNKRQISYSAFPSFFVTSQDTHFVRLQWYNKKGSDLVITEDMIAKANIQLEKGKTSTSYEPYYKKKISFNIGEPLRSLPNGISDEITDDGRLIRRVGKVVLDGSEDERFTCELVGANLEYGLFSYLGIPTQNSVGLLCDRFVAYPHSIYSMNKEGCYFVNNFKVKLLLTKLPSADAIGFKQWLSQNPTTVYYELAEPIITPIEPIEFDVKPLATMTINSDIAPVSNHKVVLNRAGQIEQGIVQIAELKKRVDSLETVYDSYLLETQHKLSILGFEYELESEEI